MESVLDPNKAKAARRVIEVLEFFDEHNRHATVMDIARRYNRPQSSTSELLAVLVEMGLLYKDPGSRSYRPTPRAAMLGSLCQPAAIRDGRLFMLTERLVAQTGFGTALMGMIGLEVQLFRWLGGSSPLASPVPGGLQLPLCDSAAGWLLLSTVAPERRDGILRRLRAELPADRRFDSGAMRERIEECTRLGYVVGPSGITSTAVTCAILLPNEPQDRPMVLGLVYEPKNEIDGSALVALLQKSVQEYVSPPGNSVRLWNEDQRPDASLTYNAA